MSKRFGRNQKRAMRARIAGLETSLKKSSDDLCKTIAECAALEETVERTAQVLGDHFVTLPVKTKQVKEMLDSFKVSIFQPHRVGMINSAVLRALDYVEMDTHQASACVDELRTSIHMRYSSISGCAAYAISDRAWMKLSEGHLIELLTQQIAPEMAKHLVRERKKRGR